MKKYYPLIGAFTSISILSACASAPEAEPEIVEVPVIQRTCVSLNLLTRQVIPAITKTGTSITSIETPPEYIYNEETGKTDIYQSPPIERKEPWVKVIKPEEVIYVDAVGKQVTDICELKSAATEIPTGNLPPPPQTN